MGTAPSRLVSDPPPSSPIFTQHALPAATLPLYPGLEQAPKMLACIPSGVVGHLCGTNWKIAISRMVVHGMSTLSRQWLDAKCTTAKIRRVQFRPETISSASESRDEPVKTVSANCWDTSRPSSEQTDTLLVSGCAVALPLSAQNTLTVCWLST